MDRIQPYSPSQLREFHDRNRSDTSHPIGADDLAEFLREPGRWRTTVAGLTVPATQDLAQLSAWMQVIYDELGFKGTKIVVPALPRITDKQQAAFARFGMRLFYIPAVGEDAYPAGFVKPAWDKYLDVNQIERRSLPGKWVAVETIAKCDWNDPQGYGGGNDPVAAALKLTTRFNISWDDHHARKGTLPRLAKLGNFPKRGTRFGTAEELNFIANLFNHLRTSGAMTDLPDLGATDSWEWCENAYGSDYRSDSRPLFGYRGNGGLSAMGRCWRVPPSVDVAFRVLVQF